MQRPIARQNVDLDLAGLLQPIDQIESLRNGRRAHEQTVVAKDHRVLAAEVGNEPLALAPVEGRSFILVIGDMARKSHGGLRQRHQALRQRAHGCPGAGVRVDDAFGIVPGAVHGAVDHIAGGIDRVVVIGLQDGLALEVDLDEARGGDLLIQHAVGIDQHVLVGTRHARRDVVVDEVRHAVERNKPVAGGEIDARAPFLGGHSFPQRATRKRQCASHATNLPETERFCPQSRSEAEVSTLPSIACFRRRNVERRGPASPELCTSGQCGARCSPSWPRAQLERCMTQPRQRNSDLDTALAEAREALCRRPP